MRVIKSICISCFSVACSSGCSNTAACNKRLPVLPALMLLLLALLTGCATTPNNLTTSPADAAQFNAELGASYLQRGDLDQARLKLEKALEQDRTNALAHVSFARLQQEINQFDLAQTHYKRALVLQPDEASHSNSYGVFLCETGEVDEAVTQFSNAASNPFYQTPEFALDNAGLCLLDAERLGQAETYLRDALRRNPRFPNALLHMADLTYRQQRLDIANAYLGRFERYASSSAASLLLGMNINRATGDQSAAQGYANRLLNDFPKSREAGEYLMQPL